VFPSANSSVVQTFKLLTNQKSSPATRHSGAWGGGYSPNLFLTSALDGVSGQRHALAALCPGERTAVTHCAGGWVGLRAGLDTEVRGKIPCPMQGIEHRSPGRPVRSQTLYWLSYPGSSLQVRRKIKFAQLLCVQCSISGISGPWRIRWLIAVCLISLSLSRNSVRIIGLNSKWPLDYATGLLRTE
jgi:hypothetical protein